MNVPRGLVEDRCHICHEDGLVVAFPCRPRGGGCTIKLCPECVGTFVHHGSKCTLCMRTNAASACRDPEMRPYICFKCMRAFMGYVITIVYHVSRNAYILVFVCVIALVVFGPDCKNGKLSPDTFFCKAAGSIGAEIDRAFKEIADLMRRACDPRSTNNTLT